MERLPILFQDNFLIAINKPNGLQVHRSKISEEKEHFALQQLRDQLNQRVDLVHRLDRPTSGVLLFALQKEALQHLRKQFENHEVQKGYWAVVRGYTDLAGSIDEPLKRMETHKKSKVEKPPQSALTHYKRLKTIEVPIPVSRYNTARYSLVEVQPETGRMRQIRRHFAHLRHYIIGDNKHGERHHNRMFREKLNYDFMFLHSTHLSFTHPVSQEKITIQSYPMHWQPLFDYFGWGTIGEDILHN